MIFFTSDQHFGHVNIIKYCQRPFAYSQEGCRQCDEFLKERYNSVVKPEDYVFFLGDVTLGGGRDKEYCQNLISSLHGYKVLILGNHDKESRTFYQRCGFLELRDTLKFGRFFLCHYPLDGNEEQDVKKKVQKLYPLFKDSLCDTIIHGHTHNRCPPSDAIQRINVCVDNEATHFSPVRLDGLPEQDINAYFTALLRSRQS